MAHDPSPDKDKHWTVERQNMRLFLPSIPRVEGVGLGNRGAVNTGFCFLNQNAAGMTLSFLLDRLTRLRRTAHDDFHDVVGHRRAADGQRWRGKYVILMVRGSIERIVSFERISSGAVAAKCASNATSFVVLGSSSVGRTNVTSIISGVTLGSKLCGPKTVTVAVLTS